jgi:hypothetical protein
VLPAAALAAERFDGSLGDGAGDIFNVGVPGRDLADRVR